MQVSHRPGVRGQGSSPLGSNRGKFTVHENAEGDCSGSSPIALMAKAGHSDMKTTRIYLHLAGTVFRDEAEALERRLLGIASGGSHPSD
jgi:hypothetical protein